MQQQPESSYQNFAFWLFQISTSHFGRFFNYFHPHWSLFPIHIPYLLRHYLPKNPFAPCRRNNILKVHSLQVPSIKIVRCHYLAKLRSINENYCPFHYKSRGIGLPIGSLPKKFTINTLHLSLVIEWHRFAWEISNLLVSQLLDSVPTFACSFVSGVESSITIAVSLYWFCSYSQILVLPHETPKSLKRSLIIFICYIFKIS